MPLPERVIQPVSVSRDALQYKVPDVLEGVTNGTLANIIRQLSSLSRHAEEIFGNLFKEARDIAQRECNLQARIDRLAIKVTQLDSTVEEVSLQEIQLRKAFRSNQSFDQQVVARSTMSKAMMELYMACDEPPPLNKLNPYRDDGKDALSFYTNPNYFFELWRQNMQKDMERKINDRGKKNGGIPGERHSGERHKKRGKVSHNAAERQRQKSIDSGGDSPSSVAMIRPNNIELRQTATNGYHQSEEPLYMPRILRTQTSPLKYNFPVNQDPEPHDTNAFEASQQFFVEYGTPSRRPTQPPPAPPSELHRRDSLPPPPPPPPLEANPLETYGGVISQQRCFDPVIAFGDFNFSRSQETELPPPPPNPVEQLPPPPVEDVVAAPPPPPPLPPPTNGFTSPPAFSSVMLNGNITNDESPTKNGYHPNIPHLSTGNFAKKNVNPISMNSTVAAKKKSIVPPHVIAQDGIMTDLLKAIRDGIALKKVEQNRSDIGVHEGGGHHGGSFAMGGGGQTDVASILARRVAVEMSDSDEVSGSDYDSDEWEDESTA